MYLECAVAGHGFWWTHVDPTVQYHQFSPLAFFFLSNWCIWESFSSIRLISCWLDLFTESKASCRRSNIGIKIFFNLATTASSWSESASTIISLNVSVSIAAMFVSPTEDADLNPDRVDITKTQGRESHVPTTHDRQHSVTSHGSLNGHRGHNQSHSEISLQNYPQHHPTNMISPIRSYTFSYSPLPGGFCLVFST